MRTRAYRPEVPGYLEGRSLLSGVAGLAADPIVLPRRQFNLVPERIQSAFQLFRQGYGVAHLHDEILDAVAWIPYGRVGGLAASINVILSRMQHDISAKVPNAISSARHNVIAVTRADVEALAQAGDLVVR
jgi:hypothetical protein